MSQINLKSITGITSITTPAGVDNVFTVHSNDTTERFRVDSNGSQVIAGILTVTQDLDVDGHTNLDNVSIAGVTTVSDNIEVVDSKHVYWGTDKDLSITHTGTHGYIHSIAGGLYMKVGNGEFLSRNGSQVIAKFLEGTGGVELYHNNVKRLNTSSVGVSIPQDLDVDGHTNLDNVSIAGVTTSTGNIYADNYFGNSGLTLNNNGNPSVNLISSSTGGSSRINFGDPDSNSVGKIYYNHNYDFMYFSTAYNERLRIMSGGAIGINTTSGSNTVNIGGAAGLGVKFHNFTTGNSSYITVESGDKLQSNVGGSGYYTWVTGGSEKVRITSTGYVGIQTADPKAFFHASRPSTAAVTLNFGDPVAQILQCEDSEFALGLHNANPYPLYIQGRQRTNAARNIVLNPLGGNIGIGTLAPSQKFTSYASSGYPILANGPSNGIGLGGNGVIVFGNRDLASYGSGAVDASDFQIKISGSSKFTITSGGQVQISGGSTPFKVTHTGADCAQFHRGSKYLGINADWGGNTGDSVISVSTNFVVHTNGSSERFRIASDGTATFGNNTSNGTYVTIDPVANNGRVRIGHPTSAVAKGKVIIDNADRNAMTDLTDPDNYGVVLCGSPTTGQGNGITFCNDNAQNAGAGIVHVDEGSNNLGSLRFYTKDEGQVPYETLRMGKYGNLVTSTASWRAASEKYVDTYHMPQAHEGYNAGSSYSGLSVAAEMWHQSHVRGTSHLTTELFSTRMGHNAGMFIYVEVWFSCAVSNYQGYQALWANANRTGSADFTINNTGQEGNQLGTDTGGYFNLTYASAGSAGNQRLTWKVTTSFGQNYTRVLYKSTVVGHDYFTDLTVIR